MLSRFRAQRLVCGWIVATTGGVLLCAATFAQAPPASAPDAAAPATPAPPAKKKFGPPYEQLEYHELLKAPSSRELRTAMGVVNKVVNGSSTRDYWTESTDNTSNQIWFKNYFQMYLFPQLTEIDPSTGAPKNSLPELRDELGRHFARIRDQKVHDALHQLTATWMKHVAFGNFHPAVRYNAMLILGDLNDVEGKGTGSSSERRPPSPDLQMLGLLFKTLNAPETPDYLNVAALIGIRRHAVLDGQKPKEVRVIPPEAKAAILGKVGAILLNDTPPEGRSAAGHRWMQELAMEIVAGFGDPGIDNKFAARLVEIMNDKSRPLTFRTQASKAYASLQFTDPKAIDPGARSADVAYVALASISDELSHLTQEQERRDEYWSRVKGDQDQPMGGGAPATPSIEPNLLSGTDGGLLGGSPGGIIEEMTPEKEFDIRNAYRLRAMRARLKARLSWAQIALKGPDEAGGLRRYFPGGDANVTLFDEIYTDLGDLMKQLEETEELPDLLTQVGEAKDALKAKLDASAFKREIEEEAADDAVSDLLADPTAGDAPKKPAPSLEDDPLGAAP